LSSNLPIPFEKWSQNGAAIQPLMFVQNNNSGTESDAVVNMSLNMMLLTIIA